MMDLFKAFFNNKFFSYDGGFIVEAKYESLDVNAMACTYIIKIEENLAHDIVNAQPTCE